MKELAAGFEPIRKGEIFWLNNNSSAHSLHRWDYSSLGHLWISFVMFVINGENLKKKRTAKIALSSVFHNPSSQLNNLIYLHSFLFQLLLFFIGVAHFFCFPSAATTTTTIITTTLLFFPQRPSLYCHCFPSITTTILPLFSSTTTTFITATFPLFSHHHHRHFSIVFLPDRLFRWPMRPFFFTFLLFFPPPPPPPPPHFYCCSSRRTKTRPRRPNYGQNKQNQVKMKERNSRVI